MKMSELRKSMASMREAQEALLAKLAQHEEAMQKEHGRAIPFIADEVLLKSEDTRALLQKSDDIYLLACLTGKRPQDTSLWKQNHGDMRELRKAMHTTSGSNVGEDWIPTGFSPDLVDKVRMATKVASLFRTINMPQNPYEIPAVASDATAYLQGQSTADDASKLRASTPGTRKVTLSAVKLAARTLTSEEQEEDSIIPMLPFIRANIIRALADGKEKAILDGDTSATHQDSDVTASYDARKAWPGLRKLCLSACKVDFSTWSTSAGIGLLRSLRTAMGVYGVNPTDLAFITGTTGYNDMLGTDQVTTVDKYGPKATIHNGELGSIDGIPIIVSEHIRETLNASGVYDGVTTDNTIVALVYRPGFVVGDRRKPRMRVVLDAETEQNIVVASERLDFKPLYVATTETIVALGYNLAS